MQKKALSLARIFIHGSLISRCLRVQEEYMSVTRFIENLFCTLLFCRHL